MARLFGPFFVFAGIMHFVRTRWYERIMPPYIPRHRELVYISGVAEIAGGLATMHPRTRRVGSAWSIATLLAVFPANVHMAIEWERYEKGIPGGRRLSTLGCRFSCCSCAGPTPPATGTSRNQRPPCLPTWRQRYSRTMVLKRVIPCLDVDNGRVVKGTNFVDIRDAGDPVELAERYDAEGADELVFLDITASHESRDTIVELARRTADNVFIPFTIGGGHPLGRGRAGRAGRGRRQGLGQLGGPRAARADLRARGGLRLTVRRDRDRREAPRRVIPRSAPRALRRRVGRLRQRRSHTGSRVARRSTGQARRPSAGRGRCC